MIDAVSRTIAGEEHWTNKGDVRLFLWNKVVGDAAAAKGTILFVHGSSMASTPTFDLQVPGEPDYSAMDYFARRGYDCWCVDMEGYGRSTKDRDNNAPIAQGAEDCFAAGKYIQRLRAGRKLLVYGVSSGALPLAKPRSISARFFCGASRAMVTKRRPGPLGRSMEGLRRLRICASDKAGSGMIATRAGDTPMPCTISARIGFSMPTKWSIASPWMRSQMR